MYRRPVDVLPFLPCVLPLTAYMILHKEPKSKSTKMTIIE